MDFALRHRDRLVAFDLAGDEQAYPPSLYLDVIERLDGSGLKLDALRRVGRPAVPREAVERSARSGSATA